MGKLEGLDLPQLDDLLDEEEHIVRDSVRSRVEKGTPPHGEEWAWRCHSPRGLSIEPGELDLLSAQSRENLFSIPAYRTGEHMGRRGRPGAPQRHTTTTSIKLLLFGSSPGSQLFSH